MSVFGDLLTTVALIIFFIFIMLVAIQKARQRLAKGSSSNYFKTKKTDEGF